MKGKDAESENAIQHSPCDIKDEAKRALRIVIAGGGTGGHLFPGIAIAQEFIKRNPKNRVLFAGAGKPFEISVLSKTGFEHTSITTEGIKGRGLINQIVSISIIPKGIIESIRFLKRFRPDIVIGVGGYAAGPIAMGAWLLGVKIVVHEQNILPGITNRLLSFFADRIYVSFNNTRTTVSSKKVLVTGNPVRREILECVFEERDYNGPESEAASGQGRPFRVLIIGGSQGAHSINLAVVEALGRVKDKDAFSFTHQTGIQDEEMVKKAYRDHDISSAVKPFFDDMARQYNNADLVICRAGATTVAEVTSLGKGVIFIPFPHAADNHQVLNARTLADTGAAEMILDKDLSGKSLVERIEHYASNPEALNRMASRAGNLGKPDAARVIVDDCYRLVNP
ncbi:undecaprenyldiphospho-muramoylpentapeptide beta-N-acetylglucosaminyltransferase [Thermodesulfobacteriota bacterium]